MNDLAGRVRFAGIESLARGLRHHEFSAVELAEATCDLLERDGPRYNAVAAVVRDRALSEARAAQRRLRRRSDARPLLGIPYGLKDLIAANGAPTTWGSPAFAEQRFERDATVVHRLRRAGAVLAAKLAMVELAGGGGYRYASASLQGPCRNPWDLTRWAGGSSSGSAAAVAAGLIPFALGSETSGSIGAPAAYCGLSGIRPTYGLVSRSGAMSLSWTLDKIGCLARSVGECATVLSAIAGHDGADKTSARRTFRRLDPAGERRALRDLRIGLATDDLGEYVGTSARGALERGIAELRRRLRARDRRVALPELPYGAMVHLVHLAEGATAFAELIQSPRLAMVIEPFQRAALSAGLEITARDYLSAMRLRTQVSAAFASIFRECDVILSLGRSVTATLLTEPVNGSALEDRLYARTVPVSRVPKGLGNRSMSGASNLAGLPAVFFPCGLGTDGLPVGLQLIGPPFSEPLLVAVADAYQRETRHHLRRPPT